ncbi:MAG: RagB/SusD family nutrient uptake outer membrane protein [Muribaculaceae bacterium]|nr:RagB/SusD family nutrient uptake outer membrane protein [Muribaculaceae bacterium]
MKKHIIFGALAVASIGLTGCNDLLERDRFQPQTQVNQPAYWNTENNVNLQLNGLYGYYTGYGNGATWSTNFYNLGLSDDQTAFMQSGVGMAFAEWNFQVVPTSSSVWSSTYTALRRINTIIEGLEGSTLPEGVKNNALGVARMNRAYQYWDLVRCYGDVPLIKSVLNTDSEEMYAPRTNRNEVMDYVLDDLNFAVAHIIKESSKIEWSNDMAQAMKAEICLFEGAFAKYHQNDDTRATKFFTEAANAAGAVMNKYPLCEDYQSLYNSYYIAQEGIPSLTANPEIIFMKGYASGQLANSLVPYICNQMNGGITKDAFDAYLFKDGLPKALTTENTDDAAVKDADGNYTIAAALAVRDERLSKTVEEIVAFGAKQWARPNANAQTSITGYMIKKFNNVNIPKSDATTEGRGYTCAPIFWGARVKLAYAEAKAELGTLTDADLNATINQIFQRAGLPTRTVAQLSAIADPANNMGVSNLLWEIRRCRRCERIMDENIRYWDLIRWHQLDKLDTQKYPNIMLGANLSNVDTEDMAGVYTNSEGYIQSNVSNAGRKDRIFTDREYLYPIGSGQIDLYKEHGYDLKQNPGW